MKNVIVTFLVVGLMIDSSGAAVTRKHHFLNKAPHNAFIWFSKRRTLFKDEKGTSVFEKSQKSRDYIYYGQNGFVVFKKTNGVQQASYKGFYNNLTLNIDFDFKNNFLRPKRAWISPAKVFFASTNSVEPTCAQTPSNLTKNLKELALAINQKKTDDELLETIDNALFDRTCPKVAKKKILTAIARNLMQQKEESGFLDCIDNPKKYAENETLSDDLNDDFVRIGTGLSTVLADIDSGSYNGGLVFSCTKESNSNPIKFAEGSPRKIIFSTVNRNLPTSINENNITSYIYHELLHFSGVKDEKKIDAILGMCLMHDKTQISKIAAINGQNSNISDKNSDDSHSPPWEANPSENIIAATQNIDTSKMSGTEPLPAPTVAEQKAIAVLYQDDAPVEVKTEAARVAANGLGNTFNGIKQFANAVMSTAVPNAIAAQTMTINDSSSYKATSDTTSTTSKTNNVKSDPRYKVVEEYVVPPGTQMKPGTAIRLSFNASENEKTDKPAAQNLEVLNNKNLNQPRAKETAKAAGRLPSNEGSPIYADVSNPSPEVRQPGASQGSQSNSNIQAPRNTHSRKSTSSPFEKMTADEMTSFLKNNKVKTVRQKIDLYQNEFDQKLKDINIRVELGKQKFGPKKPKRTFIQSGDVLMESRPNK